MKTNSYIERARGTLSGSVTALMEQLTYGGTSADDAAKQIHEWVQKAIDEWWEEAP